MTDRTQLPHAEPVDYAALGLGLLAVSVSAILIKLCISPPTTIAFGRLLLAATVFLGWELVRRRRIDVTRRDFLIAALAAVFLALHFYFWIASLFMTSINSSVVLLATQPLFALVLQAGIHRTPISLRNTLSLLGGLGGAAVLARGDFLRGGIAGQGDIYSIVSAAMAACYLFVGSHRRSPLVPWSGVVYALAGAMLVGVGLARGDTLLPARQIDWLWIALLALVPTLVGHTMLNRATMHFPTYVVNLSLLVEPALTSILAFIVFGELLTGNVILGGVFIIGAVVVEMWPGRRSV